MFLLPSLTRLPSFEMLVSKLSGYQLDSPVSLAGSGEAAVSASDPLPPQVVDLGTCFGQDLRLLASRGVPTENMWALDRDPKLWKLGYELFRDAGRFHAQFIQADFIEGAEEEALSYGLPAGPMCTSMGDLAAEGHPTAGSPPSDSVAASALRPASLEPLRCRCDVIIANQFIHLFTLPQQTVACIRITKLSRPGTILVGYQQGRKTARAYERPWGVMYFHNARTWLRMWRLVEAVTRTKWRVDVREAPLTAWGMEQEDTEWMPEDHMGLDFLCERLE